MATLDHAHSLLRLARRDYDALVGMQASALFADAIFGFHAQQAVEKALKAWLTVRGRSYPFTHDLAGLLMRLQDAAADVERCWPLERFRFTAFWPATRKAIRTPMSRSTGRPASPRWRPS